MPSRCKAKRDVNDYLTDRLQVQLNRSIDNARFFRILFLVLTFLSLAGAATIPVLVVVVPQRPVPSLVLSLVVFSAILLDRIVQPYPSWKSAASRAEALQREEILFSTKTGSYIAGDLNAPKNFQLLVERVEAIIGEEKNGRNQ